MPLCFEVAVTYADSTPIRYPRQLHKTAKDGHVSCLQDSLHQPGAPSQQSEGLAQHSLRPEGSRDSKPRASAGRPMPWVNRPLQSCGLKGRENLGDRAGSESKRSLAAFQAALLFGVLSPGHRPTGRSPGLKSRDPSGRTNRRRPQRMERKASRAGKNAGAPSRRSRPAGMADAAGRRITRGWGWPSFCSRKPCEHFRISREAVRVPPPSEPGSGPRFRANRPCSRGARQGSRANRERSCNTRQGSRTTPRHSCTTKTSSRITREDSRIIPLQGCNTREEGCIIPLSYSVRSLPSHVTGEQGGMMRHEGGMMRREGGMMREPCRAAHQDVRMMRDEGALAPPSYRMMQISCVEARSPCPVPREEGPDSRLKGAEL